MQSLVSILLFASSALAVVRPRANGNFTLEQARGKTYDYVIAGGGLTGLVVANRLSEDQNKSVLVIENGYIDNAAMTSVPYLASILNTADLYPIYSVPQKYLGNASSMVLAGNVVGGGSVVNGMFVDRGANADYDAWEKLGNKGWGWSGLGPYFKKFSHFDAPAQATVDKFNITYDASAYGNGPLNVSISSYQYDDYNPIFHSWKAETNVPMPREGFAEPVGAYWSPNSVDNTTKMRCHSRRAYYDPVQTRPNLHLLTGTHVDKILFDTVRGKLTAKGLAISSRDNSSLSTQVFAAKEVILATGAVFSPHLLMYSGVGPRDVLTAAGVQVKKELPGVGSNFQDHVASYMVYNLSNQTIPNPNYLANTPSFNETSEELYYANRTGAWTFGRGNAVAMLSLQMFSSKYKNLTAQVKAQNDLAYLPERYAKNKALLAGYKAQRDILMEQFLGNDAAIGEIPIQPWGRATISLQKPLSRGTIILNTTNPAGYPVVDWNAFSNPVDKAVMVDLTRFNRQHWARKELAQFSPVESAPGAQYQTDDEIIDGFIKTGIVSPTYAHPSGGAAMMPEELGGVVSDELQVYGVDNLSIVDGSILPMIPATHLQSTMYAIAEKAADIIKSRA